MAVDDELYIVTMLKQWLEFELEAEVVGYNSVDAAVEYLKTNKVSLILLDTNMPEKSEICLFKLIKQNVKTADIPIIIITAMEYDEMQSMFKNAGAAAFFGKSEMVNPVGKKNFIRILKQTLGL